MDISIVIVNYNVKDYLHACLTSIRQAKRKLAVEVIVVDNNSIDGSLEYLIPLFPEVEFIGLKENLGFGVANNIAINKSKGKYLLILNPDTIVAEDTLELMLAYMLSNPSVGIAGCKVLNADGSFQLACRRGFPTPWNSFCKLFGLQSAFPKSKLFARYNLTYLSEDETYKVDAVIGAFMFCDTSLIKEIGGFDERYFMYGEDIDLCKEVQRRGRDVMFVHHASIIHYKGESTKRSGLDSIKQMYTAMEQFAKKYYSNSVAFIAFLKLGINVRTLIAQCNKHIVPIILVVSDFLFINFSLMIGSYIKFGQLLGFPAYAYPIVFITVSIVYFMLQFLNGEYFEHKISIPKTALSLMLSFFILSSFTYFLPDFRFSRSALIAMIGLTLVLSFLTRFGILLYRRTLGTQADRRVIIAGREQQIKQMLEAIQLSEPKNIHVIGVVYTAKDNNTTISQNLGSIEDISIIATKNKADEVIITDNDIPKRTIMNIMASSESKVKYHLISEYNALAPSRIINEVVNGYMPQFSYNALAPRFKFIKRTLDILASILVIIAILSTILFNKNAKNKIQKWLEVLIGKKTTIGLYDNNDIDSDKIVKAGLISLVSVSGTIGISSDLANKLNEYYLKNYSLSLDFDILLRYFTRKQK